jgi:hypothetical protein
MKLVELRVRPPRCTGTTGLRVASHCAPEEALFLLPRCTGIRSKVAGQSLSRTTLASCAPNGCVHRILSAEEIKPVARQLARADTRNLPF